ncbi:MAG TPA: ABC transporter ATP-binding protein, partial [Fimbriimonadaceae bacterium]|nr:ABC transporter ATP-binding protein [Fimbriimonadaceae bacterium]
MITFDRVSRWYGQVIGLNDVSCEIPTGLTALLGVNGAGKSTLMRLVTGQLRPTTGSVRVMGMEPFANPEVYKILGYCPDIDSFYEYMSGRRFVRLLGRMAGYSQSEANDRTEQMLQRVGMADRAHKPIAGYSKGMRQRIRLAQSIAHGPRVLILDEPLNGLDPIARSEAYKEAVPEANGPRNSWSWIFRMPEVDRRLPENTGYFFVGRHTGLLLYAP